MPLPVETPAPKASSLIKRFQNNIDADNNAAPLLPKSRASFGSTAPSEANNRRKSHHASGGAAASPETGGAIGWKKKVVAAALVDLVPPVVAEAGQKENEKPSSDLKAIAESPRPVRIVQTEAVVNPAPIQQEVAAAPPAVTQPVSMAPPTPTPPPPAPEPVAPAGTLAKLPSDPKPAARPRAVVSSEVPQVRTRKMTSLTAPTAASLAKSRVPISSSGAGSAPAPKRTVSAVRAPSSVPGAKAPPRAPSRSAAPPGRVISTPFPTSASVPALPTGSASLLKVASGSGSGPTTSPRVRSSSITSNASVATSGVGRRVVSSKPPSGTSKKPPPFGAGPGLRPPSRAASVAGGSSPSSAAVRKPPSKSGLAVPSSSASASGRRSVSPHPLSNAAIEQRYLLRAVSTGQGVGAVGGSATTATVAAGKSPMQRARVASTAAPIKASPSASGLPTLNGPSGGGGAPAGSKKPATGLGSARDVASRPAGKIRVPSAATSRAKDSAEAGGLRNVSSSATIGFGEEQEPFEAEVATKTTARSESAIVEPPKAAAAALASVPEALSTEAMPAEPKEAVKDALPHAPDVADVPAAAGAGAEDPEPAASPVSTSGSAPSSIGNARLSVEVEAKAETEDAGKAEGDGSSGGVAIRVEAPPQEPGGEGAAADPAAPMEGVAGDAVGGAQIAAEATAPAPMGRGTEPAPAPSGATPEAADDRAAHKADEGRAPGGVEGLEAPAPRRSMDSDNDSFRKRRTGVAAW